MSSESDKLNVAEKQTISRRDFLLKAGFTIPFLGMAFRLWDLQITNREKFLELSQGNRIRLKLFPSPRGIIYDRNDEILVTNTPSYNINLTKEDCPNPEKYIQSISTAIGSDIGDMLAKINKNKNTPSFEPFVIVEDITWDQMSYFYTFVSDYPGFEIDYLAKRFYPGGSTASHLLGYMGGISKEALKNVPKEKNRSSQILGKNGIEKIYNDLLIGEDGGRQVEVDSQGRSIREISVIDPVPGNDVRLTIDKRLQQDIEKRLEGNTGAVVVTEIDSNEILAMASLPNFDPNKFSLGINHADWVSMLEHPEKPLHNRCIQGVYSPGSTFKIAVAYAALDMGLITPETTFNCHGTYRLNRQTFNCWKPSGHGKIKLVEAIEQSCNVFFYNIGNLLGIDKINEYSHLLGLGELTGIELENEQSGTIPSREWKMKAIGDEWVPGETISASIGQSFVSATPLQLLCYLNTFLRMGDKKKPVIVKDVLYRDERSARVSESKSTSQKSARRLNPEYVQLIKTGMGNVINGQKGTAKSAASNFIQFGGKTGTTQVISNKTKKKLSQQGKEIDKKFLDHAWFIGYAPLVNPKISISVMIENGQYSSHAAAFARDTFEFYWREINKA